MIRHPRDHFEDLELRQTAFAAVDQIQEHEQGARRDTVAGPGRGQGLVLGRDELFMGQVRRHTRTDHRLTHCDRLRADPARAEMPGR